MRPSVNGDGIPRRRGVGVVAMTALVAMAFAFVASAHAERSARAVDAARRAAQSAKGAATLAQLSGGAALEAARLTATSLKDRATQDGDRPNVADCYSVRQEPIGVSWCKPSELAAHARNDVDDASEGASSALQEQEQKLPDGVEVNCEGEGPSGTAPQAHATPPSVEDNGSSTSLTVTKPSVTPGTFDPGDRRCTPRSK